MRKGKRHTMVRWGGLLIAVVLAWAVVRVWAPSRPEGTRHVVNQLWLERMPTSPRDVVGHVAFLAHRKGKLGGAGRSSVWRHLVEVFWWKLEGGKMEVFLPQDGVRAKFNVRSWACKGQAPVPFELCLEISQGDRRAVYYSRKRWRITPNGSEGTLQALDAADPEIVAQIRDSLQSAELVDEAPEQADQWPLVQFSMLDERDRT